MPSLLVETKTKLSLYAHNKVRGALEGEYGSVFKGRSMDFDDLREYLPGDDVKDIDWKASARSQQMLVKRYIAIRKHNILLVVNTGRDMAALSADGVTAKRELSVLVSGVIGYIAQKHGDLVGMIAGNRDKTKYLPFKASNDHLEAILQYVHKQTTETARLSDIAVQLHYIARHIRRRTILVIISDGLELSAAAEVALRRLAVQHEIVFVSIDDCNPTQAETRVVARGGTVHDIVDDAAIPDFVRLSSGVQHAYAERVQAGSAALSAQLTKLGISSQRITSEKSAILDIFALLERQRYAK